MSESASSPDGPYSFRCPGCGVKLGVKSPAKAGRKNTCPKCQTRFAVPRPGKKARLLDEDGNPIAKPVAAAPSDAPAAPAVPTPPKRRAKTPPPAPPQPVAESDDWGDLDDDEVDFDNLDSDAQLELASADDELDSMLDVLSEAGVDDSLDTSAPPPMPGINKLSKKLAQADRVAKTGRTTAADFAGPSPVQYAIGGVAFLACFAIGFFAVRGLFGGGGVAGDGSVAEALAQTDGEPVATDGRLSFDPDGILDDITLETDYDEMTEEQIALLESLTPEQMEEWTLAKFPELNDPVLKKQLDALADDPPSDRSASEMAAAENAANDAAKRAASGDTLLGPDGKYKIPETGYAPGVKPEAIVVDSLDRRYESFPLTHETRDKLNNVCQAQKSVISKADYDAKQSHTSVPNPGPGLSWRVHLLPYLDGPQGAYDDFYKRLYKQFAFDEPWDSPTNLKLLPQIPEAYHFQELGLPLGQTTIVRVLGEDDRKTDWEFPYHNRGTDLSPTRDEESMRLGFLMAGPEAAVPWTKPADLKLTADASIKRLGTPPLRVEEVAIWPAGTVGTRGTPGERLVAIARPADPASDWAGRFLTAASTNLDEAGLDHPLLRDFHAEGMAFAMRGREIRESADPFREALLMKQRRFGYAPGPRPQAVFVNRRDPSNSPAAYTEVVEGRLKAVYDACGKFTRQGPTRSIPNPAPGLSWRVHMLPFFQGSYEKPMKELYEKFALDEPWDSPTNKPLLDEMPEVYAIPGLKMPPNETSYVKLMGSNSRGEETLWRIPYHRGDYEGGLTYSELNNAEITRFILAGPEASVPWTKPADLGVQVDLGVTQLGTPPLRTPDGPVWVAFTPTDIGRFGYLGIKDTKDYDESFAIPGMLLDRSSKLGRERPWSSWVRLEGRGGSDEPTPSDPNDSKPSRQLAARRPQMQQPDQSEPVVEEAAASPAASAPSERKPRSLSEMLADTTPMEGSVTSLQPNVEIIERLILSFGWPRDSDAFKKKLEEHQQLFPAFVHLSEPNPNSPDPLSMRKIDRDASIELLRSRVPDFADRHPEAADALAKIDAGNASALEKEIVFRLLAVDWRRRMAELRNETIGRRVLKDLASDLKNDRGIEARRLRKVEDAVFGPLAVHQPDGSRLLRDIPNLHAIVVQTPGGERRSRKDEDEALRRKSQEEMAQRQADREAAKKEAIANFEPIDLAPLIAAADAARSRPADASQLSPSQALLKPLLIDSDAQQRRQVGSVLKWGEMLPSLANTTPSEEAKLTAGEPITDREPAIELLESAILNLAVSSEKNENPDAYRSEFERLAGDVAKLSDDPDIQTELRYQVLSAFWRKYVSGLYRPTGGEPKLDAMNDGVAQDKTEVGETIRAVEKALFGERALAGSSMRQGQIIDPKRIQFDDAATQSKADFQTAYETTHINIKQVVLGIANVAYERGNGAISNTMPIHPNPKEGTKGSGLSWRVHILPYIDEGDLYEKFDLYKPWDDPVNVAAAADMPAVYRSPLQNVPNGQTTIQMLVGDETIWQFDSVQWNSRSERERSCPLVVMTGADKAVPWTKPVDATYRPGGAIAGILGQPTLREIAVGTQAGGWLWADIVGAQHFLPASATPDDFASVIDYERDTNDPSLLKQLSAIPPRTARAPRRGQPAQAAQAAAPAAMAATTPPEYFDLFEAVSIARSRQPVLSPDKLAPSKTMVKTLLSQPGVNPNRMRSVFLTRSRTLPWFFNTTPKQEAALADGKVYIDRRPAIELLIKASQDLGMGPPESEKDRAEREKLMADPVMQEVLFHHAAANWRMGLSRQRFDDGGDGPLLDRMNKAFTNASTGDAFLIQEVERAAFFYLGFGGDSYAAGQPVDIDQIAPDAAD